MTDPILEDIARAEAWLARTKANYIARVRGRRAPGLPGHATTLIMNAAGDRLVAIDTMLAPMIAACWERGIETVACCQGEEDGAYVAFATHADAERFAQLALPPLLAAGVIENGGIAMPWEVDEWRWSTWPDGFTQPILRFRLDFPLAHAAKIADVLRHPSLLIEERVVQADAE